MVTHLHKDFLVNIVRFEEAQAFWRQFIDEWLVRRNLTGRKWLNNPPLEEDIYDFYVPEARRAVKIVQESLGNSEVYLSARLASLPFTDSERVESLVIVLELSEEVLQAVEQLPEAWLVEQRTTAEMQALISRLRRTALVA